MRCDDDNIAPPRAGSHSIQWSFLITPRGPSKAVKQKKCLEDQSQFPKVMTRLPCSRIGGCAAGSRGVTSSDVTHRDLYLFAIQLL